MLVPSKRQPQEPDMQTLTPFLRKVLVADAVISGAAAVAMIGGADLTHALLGLPSALLFWAGVALIPFVAALGMIIRTNAAPAGAMATIIGANFAWVAASLYGAFGPTFGPTLLGQVFVCAQAAAVLLFAELQVMGLRRNRATAYPPPWALAQPLPPASAGGPFRHPR
jgi:hypothetical protein